MHLHGDEGRHEGNGHGDGHDEGSRQAPQEQVDDQGRQQDAHAGVADDVLDRGLDVAGVVVGVVHPEVGKGFQGCLQNALDRLSRLHDVGIGARTDPHLDDLAAVGPGQGPHVLLAVHHLAQQGQRNGLTVRGGDQDVLQLLHLVELAHQAQGDLVLLLRDVSRWVGLVVGRHDRADPLVGDAVIAQRRGVQDDLDLTVPPSHDVHLPHALDARDEGLDPVVDELLGLLLGELGGEGGDQEGLGVDVELHGDRLVRVLGEVRHLGPDLVVDVHQRQVGVRPRLHLDGKHRHAVAGVARDRLEPLQVGEGVLQRLGDQLLDLVGAGPRVGRPDQDERQLDAGIERHPQAQVAADAQQDPDDDRTAREDRTLDAEPYETSHEGPRS